MELKLEIQDDLRDVLENINRTFMELKPASANAAMEAVSILIEPLWN